jgi:hypothetical protein
MAGPGPWKGKHRLPATALGLNGEPLGWHTPRPRRAETRQQRSSVCVLENTAVRIEDAIALRLVKIACPWKVLLVYGRIGDETGGRIVAALPHFAGNELTPRLYGFAPKNCLGFDYVCVGLLSMTRGAVMRVQTGETPASVIAFAPKKGSPDATMVADDAKADCDRAMNLAHRLSSELRAAEERAREFEAEANYFRDRAAHAEEWLARIHTEVEQTFFQKKEQQQRPVRERK